MANDVLDTLRKDINEIDAELLVLLAKRRRISHSVVEFKISNNKPIRDEQRELLVLEKLIAYGKSLGLDSYYVNNVFQTIIEDSVLHQQAMLQQLQEESGAEIDSLVVNYRKILKEYGKEKGYDYIYGSGDSAPSILYAKDSYDITNEVIKMINDKYNAAGKKEEAPKKVKK